MKPAYRPLPLHRLDRGIRHARPKQQLPWRITADDPALSVMTDLCQVAAVTTELSTPLDRGLDIMIKRGVRVLLVVDADDHILGLVTSRDIDGEKVHRILAKAGCAREDLLVSDVMTLRAKLEVLMMEDLLTAQWATSSRPCGRSTVSTPWCWKSIPKPKYRRCAASSRSRRSACGWG